MVNLSHPQGRAKFTFNEIVLPPYLAKSDVKGSNISQGKILRISHCPESGFYYEMQLPDSSVEALGRNVVFHQTGKRIWVSDAMLAKA
jgi:hypothetical protein